MSRRIVLLYNTTEKHPREVKLEVGKGGNIFLEWEVSLLAPEKGDKDGG